MSKSQNTKNEQQKNLCITSEQLTEQWKKGELTYAEYYIKLAGGEYTNDVWDVGGWQSFNKKGDVVVEVLAPVPSYEEWEQLQNWADFTNDYHELREKLEIAEYKNAELKEQINKCCLDAINRGTANAVKAVKEFGMPERIEELVKQNAQLKELLKECKTPLEVYNEMFGNKEELLTKIDEVLK